MNWAWVELGNKHNEVSEYEETVQQVIDAASLSETDKDTHRKDQDLASYHDD